MRLAIGLLQALLMIGGPLVVAALFRGRARLPWSLWAAGALTFLGSLVVHLPILWGLSGHAPRSLVVQCLVLGLLAGICEETARWLVFKRFLPKSSSFAD